MSDDVVTDLRDTVERLRAEAAAAAAALAAGEASDGHHTHNELYAFRALLHAYTVRHWRDRGVPVVKSWQHHDGEACFGGGWFIVVAELATGQVSNHYRAEWWELFDIDSVGRAPVWDGHTPAEAAERMRADLARTRLEIDSA